MPKSLFLLICVFNSLQSLRAQNNMHIYAGAGFGYRLSSIKKNEIIFDGQIPIGGYKSLQVESSDGVVSCVTGLIYCNRYEINCKLSVTQWGNNSMNKLSNRYISLGFGYRL